MVEGRSDGVDGDKSGESSFLGVGGRTSMVVADMLKPWITANSI